MKKIIISALALLLSASAIAQTQNLSSQRLDKLRQRAEMQKSSLQRQQAKVDFSQRNLRADNAPVVTPESKSATATQWATEMPAQRWFPGEWEEVQAIVVTFPYNVFPAGHIDDEDYMAEIYLPGMGMTYKWNYNTNNWGYFNGGWGAIEGKPDITDYDGKIAEMQSYLGGQYGQIAREYIEYYENKAFRSVFVNLIDAIQQHLTLTVRKFLHAICQLVMLVDKMIQAVVQRCTTHALTGIINLNRDITFFQHDGHNALIVHKDACHSDGVEKSCKTELTVNDITGVYILKLFILECLEI